MSAGAAAVSQNSDGEGSESEEGPKGNAKDECKLSFYKGRLLALLKLAITYMRLYLLTCYAFPTAGMLRKLAKKFWRAACQVLLGSTWKGESSSQWDRSPSY